MRKHMPSFMPGGIRKLNPSSAILFVVIIGLVYWQEAREERRDPVKRGEFAARCVGVVDGDTLDLVTGDGVEVRVRLLGVDAMETHNEEKMAEQAARLGRPIDEIRLLGLRAREAVRDLALNAPVTCTVPEGPPLRDPYGRVLAYVSVEGVDIGGFLLGRGLAELRRDPHPRQGEYRVMARPLTY